MAYTVNSKKPTGSEAGSNGPCMFLQQVNGRLVVADRCATAPQGLELSDFRFSASACGSREIGARGWGLSGGGWPGLGPQVDGTDTGYVHLPTLTLPCDFSRAALAGFSAGRCRRSGRQRTAPVVVDAIAARWPAKAKEWRQETRHGSRQRLLGRAKWENQHGEINSLGCICGPASVRGRAGSSNQSDHGTEDRFGGCKDQCLGFRRPQPGLLGGGTDDCEDPKRAAPRQSRDRR